MGIQVTVKSGYTRVALPNGKAYDEGQTATLSDAEYARLQSTLAPLLTVGATVADPVTAHGHYVAEDPGDPGTYLIGESV